MGSFGSVIVSAALKYLQSHPEIVDQIIGELIQAGLDALKAHNSAAKAA